MVDLYSVALRGINYIWHGIQLGDAQPYVCNLVCCLC